MKLENPFPEYGYLGPEYFCDREYVALQKGSRIPLFPFFFVKQNGRIKQNCQYQPGWY